MPLPGLRNTRCPHTSHLCPSLAWPSFTALGLGAPSSLSPRTILSQMRVLAPPCPTCSYGEKGSASLLWSQHLERSDLSLPRLGLAPRMARKRGGWTPEGPGPALPGTHMHMAVSKHFFFFLISYKTVCPSQTGRCRPSPRHCGLSGEAPMNERLATPGELSAPLLRASVRKGVPLEALSCPPPSAAGREGRPGSLVLLVPAREGGRRGSEGTRKGWGLG